MAIKFILSVIFIAMLLTGLVLAAKRYYKTKFKKASLPGGILILVAVIGLVLKSEAKRS